MFDVQLLWIEHRNTYIIISQNPFFNVVESVKESYKKQFFLAPLCVLVWQNWCGMFNQSLGVIYFLTPCLVAFVFLRGPGCRKL